MTIEHQSPTVRCDCREFLDPCGVTITLGGEWFHDLDDRGLLPGPPGFDDVYDEAQFQGAIAIELERHGWTTFPEQVGDYLVVGHSCARCSKLLSDERRAVTGPASVVVKVGDVVRLHNRDLLRTVTGVGINNVLAFDQNGEKFEKAIGRDEIAEIIS